MNKTRGVSFRDTKEEEGGEQNMSVRTRSKFNYLAKKKEDPLYFRLILFVDSSGSLTKIDLITLSDHYFLKPHSRPSRGYFQSLRKPLFAHLSLSLLFVAGNSFGNISLFESSVAFFHTFFRVIKSSLEDLLVQSKDCKGNNQGSQGN